MKSLLFLIPLAGCHPIFNIDADVDLDGDGTTDDTDPGNVTDDPWDPTDDTGIDPDFASDHVGGGTLAGTSVYCEGDLLVVEAVSTDPGLQAVLFTQETGAGLVGAHWAEEHPIEALGGLAFESRLTTGAPIDDGWQPGQSSVFTCGYHYDVFGMMGYAVAVLDPGGGVVDCLAFGSGLVDLINGISPRLVEPSFDLSACSIVP